MAEKKNKAGNKKLIVGKELRVKIYDEGGKYITQVLLSTSKTFRKKLTIYFFSDNATTMDCCKSN